MAKPVLAMDKTEVKSILRRAGAEPVNCAMVTGKDQNVALFRVDLRKGPKIILGTLQAEFPDGKMPAHGTARVSPEDPSVLLMTLNRVPGGTARRVLKAIKGSGIKRLEITGEDGSSDASVDEEGDEADAEGTEAPAAAAPPPPAPPALDAAALTARLRTLAGRIKGVLATAPGRQAELMGFAAAAQGALKSADLAGASASLDRLEAALDAGTGAAAPEAPAQTPAQTPPPTQGAVAYGKSRLAWLAVRKKMETDVSALEKALADEYGSDALGPQIVAGFRARTAPILAALDERLADKLDEAMNAADPAQRAALVAEARQVIEAYSTFVAGESLIADLDNNPFVPLSIGQTLTGTLATLSKAVR